MAEREIELESCSIGNSQYAPFATTRRFVQAVFKNNSALPVTVRRIACRFDHEPELAAPVHSLDVPHEIAPGGRSEPIIIHFTVDL